MNPYLILLEIIDKLREDAPLTHVFYRPPNTNIEKINQARARAYIHLFLKAKFGLLDFLDRESFITDGTSDAGIDGYFIDNELKIIYFIQSKFRTTKTNFEEKEIKIEEILKMEIDRILDGETKYENGTKYNDKILEMQRSIRGISDIARYKYEIILLANLSSLSPSKLSKLFLGFPTTIMSFKKAYSELVFPILTGTFYNYPDLQIKVNLCNKSTGAKINYTVTTALGPCDITLLFIPISEIGKLMYKYKNSILKYNPRSFLTLKEGSINEEIRNTVVTKETNEFALFNNGITILSEETYFNERIGQKDIAQLSLKNPQIINGGQTAFTLSLIYEESKVDTSLVSKMNDKEVLIKVITFSLSSKISHEKRIELIEAISEATNKQNQVDTSDRNSNNSFLVESQKTLFTDFGVLLERKRGEFYDGIRFGYINRKNLIDRSIYLRIAFSCNGFPTPPTKQKKLYSEENLDSIIDDNSNFRKYYFGCLCYSTLISLPDKTGLNEALQNGIFAILAVCAKDYDSTVSDSNLLNLAEDSVKRVISKWIDFEDYAINQYYNSGFFRFSFNYNNKSYQLNRNFRKYYHGRSLVVDLNDFFFSNLPYFGEENKLRKSLKTIDDHLAENKLSIEIIRKVIPQINPGEWFNKESLFQISRDIKVEYSLVRLAVKLITSKDTGYYLWYYLKYADNTTKDKSII